MAAYSNYQITPVMLLSAQLRMANSAQAAVVPEARGFESPRHSALIRITHWITALSFVGLLVSGFAILLAHPKLYWGETGSVGTPSLIDLPLPFVLTGQTGWGRYLHFLSAWVCVWTGLIYLLFGLITQHFRKNFLPAQSDLSRHYNVLQGLTYLVVVFVLFPLMVWTGLAMSPAITSVFPQLVTILGGQQSARTIHFVITNLLVLFLAIHLFMIVISGFTKRMQAMIRGHA
jgi:thiosulfate reductase cytochrome b subunit